MINGGGLNFRKSGVLALTQSQSSPSLPGIYFTSRQCSIVCHCVCVCEESFPNFRSFRTSCRLLHILLTSPSKAWIFWHKKCFAESEKISRAFSGNGLLLLNLLTLFIFTFYCLGAPKRKEATFEFLCPILFWEYMWSAAEPWVIVGTCWAK